MRAEPPAGGGWPTRTALILAAVLLCLVLQARTIPLGYRPASSQRSILVSVEHQGAFEEQMERFVTVPLERRLASQEGLQEVVSVSDAGRSRVYLRFRPDVDLDQAYLRVREAVDRVWAGLPEGAQRPVLAKSDLDTAPVFIASFPPARLEESALRRRFENVDGAGQVEIAGGRKEEVRVELQPERAAASGLDARQVVRLLRAEGPVGALDQGWGIPLVMEARFRSAGQMEALPLLPGFPLRAAARVRLSSAEPQSVSHVDGREAVVLYVHPAGDANLVGLCRRLRLETAGLGGSVLHDVGAEMERALEEVLLAAGIGVLLVVVAAALVMRRLGAALRVALSVPVTLAGAAAVLNACGYELDLATLAGLAIGSGVAIDAAIVHAEGGAPANTRGAILFSSLTTVAVFLPLLVAPRELQNRFGGLAVAVSASVVVSLLYVLLAMPSLTLAPVRPQPPPRPPPAVRRLSERLCGWVARHRALTGSALLVLAAAAVWMGASSGLSPSASGGEGALRFRLEYASGTPAAEVQRSAGRLEGRLPGLPGVEQVTGRFERERASFLLTLEPGADPQRLRSAVQALAGSGAFLYFPEDAAREASFEVLVTGPDLRRLHALVGAASEAIVARLADAQVVFHFKQVLPARILTIPVERAAAAGVSPQEVCSILYWSLAGPVAAKWNPPGQKGMAAGTIDIRLFALGSRAPPLSEVLRIPVPLPPAGTGENASGTLLQGRAGFRPEAQPLPPSSIPAGWLAEVSDRRETGPIVHHDRQRGAGFTVRVPLGTKAAALAAAREVLGAFPFPPGYRGEAGRRETEAAEVRRGALTAVALAAVLVFLVLVFRFESLRIPLIIAAQIPLSWVGSLLLLRPLGQGLSEPVLLGLLLCAGVSVNNAILILDPLRGRRRPSFRLPDLLAARMRAVLGASLTTAAGALPLAFGSSGAGLLAPLSLTVAAGVLVSLPLTAVSLPLLQRDPPQPRRQPAPTDPAPPPTAPAAAPAPPEASAAGIPPGRGFGGPL